MNLYFLLFNQEITKELQMFTLSLCHQARQYWREWRHHCCLTTSNPTNSFCPPIRGQGHASILDLLLGCPETRLLDRSVQ